MKEVTWEIEEGSAGFERCKLEDGDEITQFWDVHFNDDEPTKLKGKTCNTGYWSPDNNWFAAVLVLPGDYRRSHIRHYRAETAEELKSLILTDEERISTHLIPGKFEGLCRECNWYTAHLEAGDGNCCYLPDEKPKHQRDKCHCFEQTKDVPPTT
jgi:hypothetical protein